MPTRAIHIFFTLILICGFYPAYYAQQLSVGLNELSKGADVIITGKVTQQTSSWNEDKSRIYTRASIQVDEYIKGNGAGNTLTVKYLGGEVGEIGEMYSHMPRFEEEEEVLVFLKKDVESTDFKVFDGSNGKISIVEDKQTGEKITTSKVQLRSLKAQIKAHLNE